MSKNSTLLCSNLVKLVIGLILIGVSLIPNLSRSMHNALLVVGISIVGISSVRLLIRYGEKKKYLSKSMY